MQLGAMEYDAADAALAPHGALTWGAVDAARGSMSPPFAEDASRREVAGMILASVALHALVLCQIALAPRTQPAGLRSVDIEMVAPPPKPPEPLPSAEVKPPEPVAVAAPQPIVRRAEPRVVPQLEPRPDTPKTAATSEDLPALPEGNDPSLSSASGHGEGIAAPAPPPPPPVVAAAPPPPPPTPVVAAHEGANYLKNPRPGYPEIAMRRGWEGEVLLQVRVGPDGRPASISVQRSSGRDVLDQAAIGAVRGWSFVPARQGGVAVAGTVTVPIVFHLQ